MLLFPPYSWTYVIKLSTEPSYYIGSTRNLLRRIKQHRARLQYFEYVEQAYPCNTYDDAYHLEGYLWYLSYANKNWRPSQLSRNEIEWVLRTARKYRRRGRNYRFIPEGW